MEVKDILRVVVVAVLSFGLIVILTTIGNGDLTTYWALRMTCGDPVQTMDTEGRKSWACATMVRVP